MQGARRRWPRLALVLALLGGALVASPTPAQATGCSGQTWPSTGSLQTTNYPGTNEYWATLQFSLTQSELCSLQQAGPYLEIDFSIRNFDVPAEWEGYDIWSTNLPGAIHDVAFGDDQYEANPAVTRIYTAQLQAGTPYYATLRWTANPRPGMAPYIYFEWTPSYWARWYDQVEYASCATFGHNDVYEPGSPYNANEGWCIFPHNPAAVRLFGGDTFAGGLPGGAMLVDGFRWYNWSPTGGSSAPPPAPPNGNPFGYLDVASLVANATKVRVQGWALDPNAGTSPIAVHTYIDGNLVGVATANTSRVDVGAAYPSFGNNHGYSADYPISVGTHNVCVYAINTGAGNANPQLPYCKTVKRHDTIDELSIVRTNHSSGRTELSAWHGSPSYTTLYASRLTGYPAISDPQWVKPLAIDTNGDGVDELGFVRFNHSSGQTELSLWQGAPGYASLLKTAITGYPAISDPQNVTPIAIDTNGDGIDELGFVRTNYPGHAELSLWHGAPHYQTLLRTSITGYPNISDPQNVTPLAIDVNGDGVDELGFLRSNTSQAELSLWQGTNYTTYLPTPLTGYPNIGDPQNVTPIAIDVNGDRIDELAFVRTNHPAGTEISVWHGAPNYTTLYASQITGYPNIGDPQNVTVMAMHLPS